MVSYTESVYITCILAVLTVHFMILTQAKDHAQTNAFGLHVYYTLDSHNLDIIETFHDKTNKMACTPSENSDQPGHPPSLIRVFAVPMKKPWILSYPLAAQRRLWSDWAEAHADLSLRLAQSHFVGFVMRRLISQTINLSGNSETRK